MKLGKLLTLTALATGITFGTFVDSADARRLRSGGSSNIADFTFAIDDEVPSSDPNLYRDAVDIISFEFREKIEGVFQDGDADLRNIVFQDGRTKTLRFTIGNIFLGRIVFENDNPDRDERLTQQDLDNLGVNDITRLNSDGSITYSGSSRVNITLEYFVDEPIDTTSLATIVDSILSDNTRIRPNFDNSFVRYNNDLEDFLTKVVDLRSSFVSSDELQIGNEFVLESTPTIVPESNNVIGLIGLGLMGMFCVKKRTLNRIKL